MYLITDCLITTASQYKDIQTFRRFIDLFDKYNGDLSSRDAEKATPLHYAAQSTTNNDKQKDDMIEYLVAKKADVDSRDIYERTPLIWAATTGLPIVIDFCVSFVYF